MWKGSKNKEDKTLFAFKPSYYSNKWYTPVYVSGLKITQKHQS